MTQRSWPWPGTTVGDAGPYAADDWDDMFEIRYGSGLAPYNDRGVIRNWLNELEVTDPVVANRVDVDTGAAIVHGKHYDNDALVNITAIPNSVGAWREDLICVRSSWVDQTIRIYRHHNPADGAVYPAPTQTDGSCWEIPLAAVRISNAGVITLITDLREYVSDLMQPKQLQVQAEPDNTGNSYHDVRAMRAVATLDADAQYCAFSFVVPSDFISLLSATIYVFTGAGGTFNWRLDMEAAHCDEVADTVTDSKANADKVAVLNTVYCLDAITALDGIEAGHHVGLRFGLNTIGTCATVNVATLLIEYR